jgi:ABC-type multidrug transport system fused ATPase/permease subunit
MARQSGLMQARETLRLAGAHAWSFPPITILGIFSSLAESFGVGLIILFLYTIMGRQGEAASASGFLGSAFSHLGAHVHSTTLLALLILAAIAAKAAFTAMHAALTSHIQSELGRDVRDRIHRQYLEVNYSYIRQREEGELLKVLAMESFAVADAYQSVCRIVINAVSMVVMIAFLLLISWPLTLAAMAGSVALFLAMNRATSFARALGRKAQEYNQELAVRMLQMLQGMRAIRAFGQEAHVQFAFEKASADAGKVATKTGILSAILSPVSDSAYLLMVAAILALATRLSIPTAAILTCIILLYRVQLPFRELQNAFFSLAEKEASLRSVAELLQQTGTGNPSPGWRSFLKLGDCIEFRDVRFGYTEGAPDALRDASFRIPAGRTTALVGASGAGKTTIVNLLLRLDQPKAGRIMIDGIPLEEIRRDQWLQRLAAAGQDIELIDSTVDANIRIARADAEATAVHEAASLAGLDAVIQGFPDGLQHWIGPHGANLSGGQRQRVGLARAILRNPDILILDEATSALDDALAKDVQRNLGQRFKGKTVLIITHRRNVALAADHVVCLEDGSVTAEGAPRDVLSKSGKPLERVCREDVPASPEAEDKPLTSGTMPTAREQRRAEGRHDRAPYYQP